MDDAAAEQAYFVDGDTLTGPNGSVTFTTAGSRQDRTRKVPGAGVVLLNMRGVLFDKVEIHGGDSGIGAMGIGAVLSDVLVKNWWNYAITHTGVFKLNENGDGNGASNTSISEVGTVCVQPIGYEGSTRDFGGATVSEQPKLHSTPRMRMELPQPITM